MVHGRGATGTPRTGYPTGMRIGRRSWTSRRECGAAFGATLVFVLALASSAEAQPFHLDDSLRGGTAGNATGGSFGADGWTVSGADDQI